MTETKDKINKVLEKNIEFGVDFYRADDPSGDIVDRKSLANDIEALIAESNRESYKKGVIDAIDATVLDEKDLPKGFEKVKSVQMKKAKEFLKDL